MSDQVEREGLSLANLTHKLANFVDLSPSAKRRQNEKQALGKVGGLFRKKAVDEGLTFHGQTKKAEQGLEL